MKRFFAYMLLLFMAGCVLGPEHAEPEFRHADSWQTQPEVMGQADEEHLANWWQKFNDPLLVEMVRQSLANNKQLAVALANIDKSKSLRQETRGALFPSVSTQAGAERRRYSRQESFGATAGTRNTYDASIDASWELDLFGRTRRAIEAADAQLDVSREAFHGLQLSIIAEVAMNYFEVRGFQRQLEITHRNIDLLREVEEIARIQFEIGVTTELDVARARGEREAFEVQLPNLEAEILSRIYRISVLTGKPPETHLAALSESKPLPMPHDQVPVGLRSDLLKRRPDIRQAERQLAANRAAVGVAEADRYPDFSLTGSLGSSARVFSDLFTTGTIVNSLAAALNWPVFQGGAIEARIEGAKADVRAAEAAYDQAVLLALEDAESALMRYGKQWQTLKRLRAAEASRQEAFDIAKLRYEAGEENFLVILDAERTLINVRNDIISSETAILTSLTQLYKSLGGGWQPLQDHTQN